MPFREKSAWVMLLLISGLGIFYGQSVISSSNALGETAPPSLRLIVLVTVALVAGAVLANILIAMTAPGEADAPADERDKFVLWRAGNMASYVLGFGVFTGLWHFVAQGDGNLLFHILVASLILSQIAEYALSIWYYRQSWVV